MTTGDPHHAPDRIRQFAEALEDSGFEAAVLSHPRDVLYLAGTAQPSNLLVVPGQAPALFSRRFSELARRDTHIADVVVASGLGPVRRRLEELGLRAGRIGMGLDALPALLYRKAAETFGGFALDDVSELLAHQRAVKSEAEIGALRRAVRMFEQVHATMAAHIRPGIAEHELAGEVARVLRWAGHDGLQFYRRWDAMLHAEGAVASGENLWTFSSQAISITGVGMSKGVPFGASRRKLGHGDLVNIDLGLVHDGYHADMARTYVVGTPTPEVQRLANAVRACQDAAFGEIRPGARARDVYDAALTAARDHGYESYFQGHGAEHGPYIGHSIGLELDEPPVLGPRSTARLRRGMVLAIEPKLIVPGLGAVNLEDDVVVRDSGYELLGSIAREVFSVSDDRVVPVRAS